jgi:hypothetical protein
MIIRICIPWGYEFEAAKSGLRELKAKGKAIDLYTIEYTGYTFEIEPRHSGPYMADTRNSFLTDLPSTGKRDLLNYDYWAYVDSDIVWSIDDLVRLLEHNKAVCCAPYLRRGGGEYCCGRWKNGYLGRTYTPSETGFKPVDFAGAGFMLIKRSVFEQMEYPYFRNILCEIPGGGFEQLLEDYSFCSICRDKGIEICGVVVAVVVLGKLVFSAGERMSRFEQKILNNKEDISSIYQHLQRIEEKTDKIYQILSKP